MGHPKPGWYADPEFPGHEREWDGQSWTANRRVVPPRKEKKPRTFLKVLLAVLVAMVVMVGGCVALIGSALNEKEKEGITRAEFQSITMGTTQKAVVDRYGAPRNAQDMEIKVPELGKHGTAKSSCIYYPERGETVLEGAFFQLCFDDGRLTSKNRY